MTNRTRALTRGDALRMAPSSEVRGDAWSNILTSQRTRRDPRQYTDFTRDRVLDRDRLGNLWRFNGLARRIVNAVPNTITRDPWSITEDTDGDTWAYLEEREFNQHLRKALRWAGLYGGSIIVIGAMDGRRLDQPLNMNAVKTIEFFRVYDRHCVTDQYEDWNRDPRSRRYLEREWYTVTPRVTVVAEAQLSFRVHHSRVIQFDGEDLPDEERVRNQGWGDSRLQAVYEEVRRFCEGLDNSSLVLRDFVQAVLQVKNLSNILASKDGDKKIQQRLEILDMSRHMLNTMLVDEGETYTKSVSTISGIGEVIDRLMASVSMVADIPQSVLFGRSPSGLNATGDMDVRMWYDSCAAYQREFETPRLRRVIDIARVAKDGPQIEEDYTLKHAPLWQMSQTEIVTMRKTQAETDKIYVDMSAVTPEEITNSRFGGDEYSTETVIEYDRTVPTEEEVAAQEAAARKAAEALRNSSGKPAAPGDPDPEEEPDA